MLVVHRNVAGPPGSTNPHWLWRSNPCLLEYGVKVFYQVNLPVRAIDSRNPGQSTPGFWDGGKQRAKADFASQQKTRVSGYIVNRMIHLPARWLDPIPCFPSTKYNVLCRSKGKTCRVDNCVIHIQFYRKNQLTRRNSAGAETMITDKEREEKERQEFAEKLLAEEYGRQVGYHPAGSRFSET